MENVTESFLVGVFVQVANEQVGANFLGPVVLTCFVHFYAFTVQFYHVHDFDGVIRVILVLELDEAEALVLVCDLVSRKVDVGDGSTLQKELPENLFGTPGVKTTDVDGCVGVTVLPWTLSSQTVVCDLGFG